LFAVRVAAQRVQAAEPRRHRRLLLRVLDGDLAREEVPAGEPQPLQHLAQHETREEIPDRFHLRYLSMSASDGHFQMFHGVCIQAATSTSQTSVTGMKI